MRDVAGLTAHSRRELRRTRDLTLNALLMSAQMTMYSDAELANQTVLLRKKYEDGKSLLALLPEAFATVRETAKRVVDLTPYDVQVEGGVQLFRGKIAEMKTGEGKTLAAAMPAYLMALTGKGVHIVTVNDYLAKRDADDIGRIFKFLGMTVGCVITGLTREERQEAYACDVTYVTNHELGFDYLRDNMVTEPESRVLRGLHYCIVDEVDSVLIDEARTPLIISGERGGSTDFYQKCAILVKHLRRGELGEDPTKVGILSGQRVSETNDYVVDEKERTVRLTAEGVARVEFLTGIENYSAPEHMELRHHVQMALQAEAVMKRDVDYVVRDGSVQIVDAFTGRIMPERRYSDGLHQALEAKEHVEIHPETQTMATISFQNFFNKYELKAGMTGTAITSADEFKAIYHLDVVEIPTNKPMIRKDEDDVVYMTKAAKRNAIVQEIERVHAVGQPVLVGTTTISESEILSEMLSAKGIPHQVLNAKYHAREAEIISHAGEAGMVTIATNMAGRGTDIRLSDEARTLGGLYVIGTERHEARRIDNQLRGRSGRQGDPGRSRFYLSLEDDVTRLFGSQSVIRMLRSMGVDEDAPVEHKSLAKLIRDAQKKAENNNFGLRKALLDFDDVNNEHRELVYAQRNALMGQTDVLGLIRKAVPYVIDKYIMPLYPDSPVQSKDDVHDLVRAWHDVFGDEWLYVYTGKKQTRESALATGMRLVEQKLAEFDSADAAGKMSRYVVLKCLDWRWIFHLNKLEQVRQSIGFVQYGQKNSVSVYKDRAYDALNTMLSDTLKYSLKLFLMAHPEPSGVTE